MSKGKVAAQRQADRERGAVWASSAALDAERKQHLLPKGNGKTLAIDVAGLAELLASAYETGARSVREERPGSHTHKVAMEVLTRSDILQELEVRIWPPIAVARLWAKWQKRTGQVNAFELRIGLDAAGDRIWTATRDAQTWRQGPDWRPCPSGPGFSDGTRARVNERYPKHVRARELGAEHVSRFLANPAEELVRGALLSGHCGHCNRELTDPVSRERGVGPECLRTHEILERVVAA